MKTVMPLGLGLLSIALLTGCASAPPQQLAADSRGSCDYQRMAQLDQVAKAQGKEMHWLNCPQIARAQNGS